MRKPGTYAKLEESHQDITQRMRADEVAPAAPSPQGNHGKLREPPSEQVHYDVQAMRYSAASPQPLVRRWARSASMADQQRSGIAWANQTNRVYQRQHQLTYVKPEPKIEISPLEKTAMAQAPHHSDSILGMIDEAELAAGDALGGIALEAGGEGQAPTAETAPAVETERATAEELEVAREAREHDAARELDQEHEHEYE